MRIWGIVRDVTWSSGKYLDGAIVASFPRQAAATFLVVSSAFCEFSNRGPHSKSATPSSWPWEQCVTAWWTMNTDVKKNPLPPRTSLAACKANRRFLESLSTILTMAGKNCCKLPMAMLPMKQWKINRRDCVYQNHLPAANAAAARVSSCSDTKWSMTQAKMSVCGSISLECSNVNEHV